MTAAGWALSLGVLGAIVGSFLVTLVIRWPQGRSVTRGRSACDACGRTLSARDLMPLVSAAMLRARCRRCGAAIDPRHWQIELASAAIGAAAGLATGGPVAIGGAVFGWLLLALAALDVAELWLPNALTAPLAATGLVAGVFGAFPPLTERLIGGVAGFAALWLIAVAYRRLRGREGLGGGDPKLLGAIGLWLGWQLLPVVVLVASVVGLAFLLLRRLRGHAITADAQLPFGALLAIGAYPAWLVMVTLGP